MNTERKDRKKRTLLRKMNTDKHRKRLTKEPAEIAEKSEITGKERLTIAFNRFDYCNRNHLVGNFVIVLNRCNRF
jgi:hypothetical protein